MTAANIVYAARQVANLGARSVAGAQARVDGYVTRQLDHAAEDLSRRAVLQARVDVANVALHRWGVLVYDRTSGGQWLNVSAAGQIQVATPWSRRQCAAYGLTDHDARILLAIVRGRLAELPPMRRALVYDLQERRWYLSQRYAPPDLTGFRVWLDENLHVTFDMWLTVGQEVGAQRGRHRGRT